MQTEVGVTGTSDHGSRRAVGLIFAGTGVLGVSGLVILTVTARSLGAVDYAAFGVFWSAMFFVVAVLFGVQQESTRAVTTHRSTGDPGSTSLVRFAVVVATGAVVVLVGAAPWWGPATFGEGHGGLALVVAAGSVGYVFTGVLAGVCAGAGLWSAYGAMLVVEGLARAVGVVGVLLLSAGVGGLAWMVVAAYPVTLAAVGWSNRARIRQHLRVDESLTVLLRNTGQTVAAAVSIAAMINGFPLLMALFVREESAAALGAMTLAVILTRAPLLLPLMALQSYLITMFARPQRSPWPLLAVLLSGCVAVAAVLAALAAAVGPPILREVFGAEFEVSGHALALLVLSSGGLGALCMSSPALVARNRHAANTVGWWIAVVVAVVVLAFAPWSLELRAPAALLAGPCLGLVWQLAALARISPVRRR